MVLAGLHGRRTDGGSGRRTKEAHLGSYLGVGWSAKPPGRRGKGVGDAADRVAPIQSGTQPSGAGFQEVRRAIEGKMYATLEDKVMAVEEFLTEFEAEPDRVRSLTWWNWIKAAVQQLPSEYGP